MEKTSLTLEITILSGEDLRINRKSITKNAFIIVQADSHDYSTTKIDKEGGSYPIWDEKLVVNLPVHVKFLTVEAQRKTSSGNTLIGTARIPVSDFVGGYVPHNYLHFLSYRLRDGHGQRNGIINLSVRAKVPEYSCSPPQAAWSSTTTCEKKNDGVVTGVPATYYYPP